MAKLGTKPEESENESVPLKREYSHSDLGFSMWEDCKTKNDTGACLGIDFGGTLTKIAFFEPRNLPEYAQNLAKFILSSESYGESGERDSDLSFYSEKLGGRLHFVNFETSRTSGAIALVNQIGPHNIKRVHATGGGAFKFSDKLKDELGICLLKQDELETVVKGIIFTLLEHPDSECYTCEPDHDGAEHKHSGVSHDALSCAMKKIPQPMPVSSASLFPFLVVNIGSGVSVIKVTAPDSFKRVSGTAIGGATYFGLCKLLCRCKTFKQAMDLAELGDSREVNLTVQDIYGGAYTLGGLGGEVTASFFGKAAAATGHVRTKRSRKRPFVSFLERIGLIILALLSTNIVFMLRNYELEKLTSSNNLLMLVRDVVALLLPVVTVWFVFWSNEAKLASSHPHTSGEEEEIETETEGNTKDGKRRRLKKMKMQSKTTCFEEADIARALVTMVAQNVTQIAFLNALVHGSERVIFTGNFLRHNRIAQRALSTMMYNWSRGNVKALFMEHEGYFGAIGAFLYSIDKRIAHAMQIPEEVEFGDEVESPDDDTEDIEDDIIEDLLYKGEFPRRRSMYLQKNRNSSLSMSTESSTSTE